MVEQNKLDLVFENAVLDAIVISKKDLRYNPGYWIQMIHESGGVGAAKRLLALPIADGFTLLWENDRLDLSVELYVLVPAFQSLFTQAELEEARKRLEDARLDIEGNLRKLGERLSLG